ncbi:hypothetical protein B0I72DRAFT_89835 [Yarrowia lipolytica]|uniref:Ribonuclease H1 N-terminal domain-containing protein n=1 Tax=Yarrowia lipolytica TaxID=4952 RepID=A0A371BX39_YARLL|nr:hypothetical protein B0I71DRAFT_90228 [Yarrowia lipolytica]RDW29373.1 hypothetical protein B0I72DRAFT_89835 [Yarrowia lipolytica]RDW36562.1 hypothetical protein B0I73DRAFT_89801 [Yarrowia lipolytica]
MPYYAVYSGRRRGIFFNWQDAENQVTGYSYPGRDRCARLEDAVQLMKQNGAGNMARLVDYDEIGYERDLVYITACQGAEPGLLGSAVFLGSGNRCNHATLSPSKTLSRARLEAILHFYKEVISKSSKSDPATAASYKYDHWPSWEIRTDSRSIIEQVSESVRRWTFDAWREGEMENGDLLHEIAEEHGKLRNPDFVIFRHVENSTDGGSHECAQLAYGATRECPLCHRPFAVADMKILRGERS